MSAMCPYCNQPMGWNNHGNPDFVTPAEVAALRAELKIVKDNYAACHSQYCAGRAVANALRAERDAEHKEQVRANVFGTQQLELRLAAQREATTLRAEVERLRGALDALVMACELPGDHCEVEQALPAARAALEPKP